MKSLQELIIIFLKSKERNLQLDFFRDNGQVLLQLYKQYDVNNWEIDYKSDDLDSSVLELRFHRDKSNNKANFERFKQSVFYKEFDQIDKQTFFLRIDSSKTFDSIETLVLKIIKEIYLYSGKFDFTLNAY